MGFPEGINQPDSEISHLSEGMSQLGLEINQLLTPPQSPVHVEVVPPEERENKIAKVPSDMMLTTSSIQFEQPPDEESLRGLFDRDDPLALSLGFQSENSWLNRGEFPWGVDKNGGKLGSARLYRKSRGVLYDKEHRPSRVKNLARLDFSGLDDSIGSWINPKKKPYGGKSPLNPKRGAVVKDGGRSEIPTVLVLLPAFEISTSGDKR